MNESHVLYLFGAGASAEAIPVVDDLPKDMKKIAGRLTEWHENHRLPSEIKERARIICTNLKDLANTVNEVKKSQGIECTVDKYISSLSKKQSVKAQVKYEKSKNTLATYILLRQFFNTDEHIQIDERYGDWLRNVVPDREQEKFANNIRCLTWNYDMQMELAYYQHFYKEKESLPPGKIINAFSYPQPVSVTSRAHPSQLGLHLNGIVLPTEIRFPDNGRLQKRFEPFLNGLFEPMLEANHSKGEFSSSGGGRKLLISLLELSKKYTLQFHWDWQNSNRLWTDAVLEKAIVEHKILGNAECVVVVGYSFPGCNGNMDRKILRSLEHLPVKIYIQDPEADVVKERITQQFELSERQQKRIIPITETSSFHIPDMLRPEN